VEQLEEALPTERALAVGYLGITALVAVSVVLIFDWTPSEMLLGAVIGTVVSAALEYFLDTAPMVPRGSVEDAPAGLEVGSLRYDLSDLPRIALVVAVPVAIAAWADVTGLGAAFAIGWPLGYSLAHGIAYVRIRRWERDHGRTVVVDPEAERSQLRPYAV
jgi:hypothetical protein